jgi:hypothetical protein
MSKLSAMAKRTKKREDWVGGWRMFVLAKSHSLERRDKNKTVTAHGHRLRYAVWMGDWNAHIHWKHCPKFLPPGRKNLSIGMLLLCECCEWAQENYLSLVEARLGTPRLPNPPSIATDTAFIVGISYIHSGMKERWIVEARK